MLVHNGKIADVHATGLRDREKNLPVERDTIFRIYSMTKLVTSTVALSLYEKNLIDLDDLDSVASAAESFQRDHDRLDVLTNNAKCSKVIGRR